jgi:predicted lipoprotein with Yx(FWY)xxD motif
MEARTKIIAAVAVIMMCAAGLVGAGYAYTASTVNEGNNASSEYLVLSQDGAGAYTFVNEQAVYYDTVNRSVAGVVTTTYELFLET